MSDSNKAAFRTILKASVVAAVLSSASAGYASAAADPDPDTVARRASEDASDLGEVIVTGTNIRGVGTILPATPITREEFERRGYTDVGQALRAYP